MKKALKVKPKAIFIIFKRFSVAKNCLRLESARLNKKRLDTYNRSIANKMVT